LIRDRLTWMVYLQLAVYGYFLYGFTPSVTLLRDDEHVSRAISGLHGTGLALGAVLVGIFAPRLVARFGRGPMMRAALVILSTGIILFVSCSIVAVTITGAVIAGFGGTILANVSAAMLTSHHKGSAGGTAVTEANGLGSGFGIFAPLLISAAIALKFGWRAGMLVTVLIAIGVGVTFRKTLSSDTGGRIVSHTAPHSRHMSFEFWQACSVLVMTTAIEFCMTIWSSDVLQNHDGLSKGTAAIGVTAIVAGMTIGRLTTGRITLRHSADVLLICVFALTLVGFAAFWVSTLVWLAFAGLFITGLGIALHFPLAITRVIGFSQGRADLATGYASLGTGIAIGIAPFALGALADHVGSHTALLAVPVFIVLATVGVATSRRAPDPVPPSAVPIAIGDVPGLAN